MSSTCLSRNKPVVLLAARFVSAIDAPGLQNQGWHAGLRTKVVSRGWIHRKELSAMGFEKTDLWAANVRRGRAQEKILSSNRIRVMWDEVVRGKRRDVSGGM